MMSFRFRAQAALDLRLHEEEKARRALGVARAATAEAARAVESAGSDLARAMRMALEEERRATDTAMCGLRRNYLAGQRLRLADLQGALARRRDEEATAAARLREAARQVCTLVKLRDRLWQAHLEEEGRAEQRELNWLGSLRHVMARSAAACAPPTSVQGEEVKACQ